MTASELNRSLDRLDRLGSQLTQELIDAGRGHEKFHDILKGSDPLSVRARNQFDERSAITMEIQRRYGPDMRRAPLRQSHTIRRKNPRKFDRCVMEVKRRGGARNPYAVCTAAGLRRRNPTHPEIEKYIRAIRNKAKKEYAIKYADWVLSGEHGDAPEHRLSVMGAQAVRMQIHAILRRQNPRYKRSSASVLARGGPLYTLIAQRPGGKRLVYTGAKFSQGGRPQLFKSVGAVKTAARFLRLKYPILKPYSFYVREAH